jgi:hypothetical protein
MIYRPRILDEQLPSHAPRLTLPRLCCQDNMTILLTDPFTVLSNAKVSDGSQPPMMFDLPPELNGWLPSAGPSGVRLTWA